MEFFNFLKQESEAPGSKPVTIAALVGIFNGLLLSSIVTAGKSSTQGTGSSTRAFILFLICFLLWVLSKKYILDKTSAAVESVIHKVRIRLTRKIQRASLLGLEALGRSPIQTVLTQETNNISQAASLVIGALSSAILVVFALGYILLISRLTFYMIAGFSVVGVLYYARASRSLHDEIMETSREESRFFESLDHLLDGFKELKINDAKAEDLFARDIQVIAERNEHLRVRTACKLNWLVLVSQGFFYALLGTTVFILPKLSGQTGLPVQQITAVLLFIIGPIGDVIAAIPALTKANVSIMTLRSLEESLETVELDPAHKIQAGKAPAAPFQSLACQGVTFRYPQDNGHGFQVGPIDLEIKRGEVVFLIGGNGTGKSTLLKLLCGLYMPRDGRLLVNDQAVTPSRLPLLRGYFSIILQDFHLFHRLLGHAEVDVDRAQDLCKLLQIDHVTGVMEDGQFSSIQLSTGQKKRLALLVAEFDDREVYVFDEWAADQDPGFRRFFYREFLPLLVERGKTIIAATHDDHYFDVADRVLEMSDGQISPYRAGA